MNVDRRVVQRYELTDEDGRLWVPGKGDLVRLRTWDIFDRYLPERGAVVDVGGGPGTHAAHLARKGYDVVLIDPIPRHLDTARARSAAQPAASFQIELGEARALPLADQSMDAALLMGPLYHLVQREDRELALQEVSRVLKHGGCLLAEIITRHAWLLDATTKGLLGEHRDLG